MGRSEPRVSAGTSAAADRQPAVAALEASEAGQQARLQSWGEAQQEAAHPPL